MQERYIHNPQHSKEQALREKQMLEVQYAVEFITNLFPQDNITFSKPTKDAEKLNRNLPIWQSGKIEKIIFEGRNRGTIEEVNKISAVNALSPHLIFQISHSIGIGEINITGEQLTNSQRKYWHKTKEIAEIAADPIKEEKKKQSILERVIGGFIQEYKLFDRNGEIEKEAEHFRQLFSGWKEAAKIKFEKNREQTKLLESLSISDLISFLEAKKNSLKSKAHKQKYNRFIDIAKRAKAIQAESDEAIEALGEVDEIFKEHNIKTTPMLREIYINTTSDTNSLLATRLLRNIFGSKLDLQVEGNAAMKEEIENFLDNFLRVREEMWREPSLSTSEADSLLRINEKDLLLHANAMYEYFQERRKSNKLSPEKQRKEERIVNIWDNIYFVLSHVIDSYKDKLN